MASRDAKLWAVLEEVTAANLNKEPGGWIGYAATTSDQTGLTGSGNDILSLDVNVHTNRLLLCMCEGHVQQVSSSAAWSGEIVEGGSTIGRWGRQPDIGATAWGVQSAISNVVHQSSGFALRIDPSNGTHTFKMQVSRQSGSGTLTVSGSSPAEAKIVVIDLGPSS